MFTAFDFDVAPDLRRRPSRLSFDQAGLRLGEAGETLSVFEDFGRACFKVAGGLELRLEFGLALTFGRDVPLETIALLFGEVGAGSFGAGRDFGGDSHVDLALDQEGSSADHSAT